MKEPIRPYPPSNYDYEKKIVRKFIYQFEEIFDEDREWEDEQIPISEINLQWLLDKLPEGVNPEQVKINFGYNASSMSYDDHYVGFYYEETVPARKEEYKETLLKYKIDLAKYEQQLKEYEKFCLKKEIKEAEEKLKKLK